MEFFFHLGAIASAVYLMVLPESPIYYFINEGNKSKRGIDVLNYIATINGSDERFVYGDECEFEEMEQDPQANESDGYRTTEFNSA